MPGGRENGQNSNKVPDSLSGLSEMDLNLLFKTAQIRRLTPGEYLIREGDADQAAYIILDGRIKVLKNIQGHTENIAVLEQGQWVGEIAFTRRIQRTASAVADGAATVLILDKPTLGALNPQAQLFFYQRLNDLAAQRVTDLSVRESVLARKNILLMSYITEKRGQRKEAFIGSELVRNLIDRAPELPGYAVQLTGCLFDQGSFPESVGRLIKTDPLLPEALMNIYNSSEYNAPVKASDPSSALAHLGINEACILSLVEALRRTLPAEERFAPIIDQAAVIGRLCFFIAGQSRVAEALPSAAIGVFHDAGLGMIQVLKHQHPDLTMLIDALDAAQIGALLLRKWRLPERVADVVEHQFHPEFSPPAMLPEEIQAETTVLHLAYYVFHWLQGGNPDARSTPFIDEYLELMGWKGLTPAEIWTRKLAGIVDKKRHLLPACCRGLFEPALTKPPHLHPFGS